MREKGESGENCIETEIGREERGRGRERERERERERKIEGKGRKWRKW